MKKNGFWLSVLNVRPDEQWLVKKLFILQFLQGAGIAFFFTASYALFLDEVGVTALPYVYILSAFLLWGAGFVYSKAEHAFSPGRLAIVSTLFIAVSILFFRFLFQIEKDEWLLYLMLAWFNVLYLLNNLEFWGLAAILFNVRQSKRLFGLISAGDIPAKFVGYTLALLTVEYIGTINLFWAAAACVLASLPFLQSIIKNKNLLEHQHEKKHVHHQKQTSKVTLLAKNFSGNILIRHLALLTVVLSTCFIIINYAFYSGVKEAFKDDVAMAKFIAMFLATTRIIALFIKVVFTSRLINRLGIINSLLITPVAMMVLISMVLATKYYSPGSKIIFYLFGVTAIAVDVLRSSINSPVFLTIMQPLPTHERLRAHTIIKGIMDPFASLFTGILLLAVFYYQRSNDLTNIYYILLALGVVWITGIYKTNKEYLKTIVKTIRSRYFNRDDLKINDSQTVKWLKEKIQTGDETEALNILKILDSRRKELSHELLMAALANPAEKVKLEALSLMSEMNIDFEKNDLLPLLHKNNSPAIIACVITLLCKDNADADLMRPLLEDDNSIIKNAAVSAILKKGHGELEKKATACLHEMAASEDPAEQANAAKIIGGLKNHQLHQLLLPLLQSENKMVRTHALAAAGCTKNHRLLGECIKMLHTDEKAALHALSLAGEEAVVIMQQAISGKDITQLHKEKLVQLAGKINGHHAHHLLLHLLSAGPELHKPVLKALFRSQYIPEGKHRHLFEDKALLLLEYSAGVVYMQTRLENKKEKYQVLINSLKIELDELRDSLLYIFGVMYDREKINQVRSAYLAGKKETIINALEIIEMLVRKDLANKFSVIFEPGDISNRQNELHKLYPADFFEKVEMILIKILTEGKHSYHYWTMACSLYTSKKQQHTLDSVIIDKYILSENRLLKETAEFAK